MRRLARENALCALLAGAGCATMAWLGLYGFGWNDYETEAKPAFDALTHGHLLEFLRLAPAYGGSLIERAPFALLPGLWGGGQLAVYRMVALPCLLASAALGAWLVAQMREHERSPANSMLAKAIVLGICVANPLTLEAFELGHAEELLGACMCVAAVLLAARDRPVLAGLLLGLAIANKEWALLAAGPVLLALPSRRALCVTSTLATAAVVLAPLALVGSGGFVASARGAAAPPSTIFQPWQVFWFLGRHGPVVHGLFGEIKLGYRTAPTWVGVLSHPLVVVAGLGTSAALWLRRRHEQSGTLGEREALLLLALVLLLRCLLDTWNTGYYMLPFLLALLSWEALGSGRRTPLLTLVAVILPWIGIYQLSAHGMSADLQSAIYMAWTLPLCAGLTMAVFAPGLMSRLTGLVGAQEMTVSSLGRPVSTS
jgi:hypothetical protein